MSEYPTNPYSIGLLGIMANQAQHPHTQNPQNTGLSYKDAGVDIDAGDALVERIKPFAKKTMREGVLNGLGGFGALFEISKKYQNPVLVSGTDASAPNSNSRLNGAFTIPSVLIWSL